jgi:predicted transcriptional regulator
MHLVVGGGRCHAPPAVPRIPTIKGVMTAFPHVVRSTKTLAEARDAMATKGVNHLPVIHEDRVAGLLTRRELDVGMALGTEETTVWQVCLREPVLVDLNERLDRVAARLSERRLGVAIVLREEKVVGIITPTDVCRLWGEALRELAGVDDDEGGDVA